MSKYLDYLLNRGLTYDVIAEFGIIGDNNRIAFPIHDVHGKFVNYVPRKLDNSEPRYDFSLVQKSNYLFNYHRARAERKKAIIVVEGFFGAIALHMAGYRSVVALMGVAMSAMQEQYLTRWWQYVILMMDGNQAGRNTQSNHFVKLKKRNLAGVYMLDLPYNSQPDHLTADQLRHVLTYTGI